MNTPAKIGIVVALAAAVVAAVAMKPKAPPPAASQPDSASPGSAAKASPTTAGALPRFVDLGADKCIPCKMMAPILKELKKEYEGRLRVEFIDVWQTPDASKEYNILTIPTQIFFDPAGKELFRHEGFYSKEDILGKWKELGVTFAPASDPQEGVNR
jgi:thioredoxin 1